MLNSAAGVQCDRCSSIVCPACFRSEEIRGEACQLQSHIVNAKLKRSETHGFGLVLDSFQSPSFMCIWVDDMVPGSPAANCIEIERGDMVTEINGVLVGEKPLQQVLDSGIFGARRLRLVLERPRDPGLEEQMRLVRGRGGDKGTVDVRAEVQQVMREKEEAITAAAGPAEVSRLSRQEQDRRQHAKTMALYRKRIEAGKRDGGGEAEGRQWSLSRQEQDRRHHAGAHLPGQREGLDAMELAEMGQGPGQGGSDAGSRGEEDEGVGRALAKAQAMARALEQEGEGPVVPSDAMFGGGGGGGGGGGSGGQEQGVAPAVAAEAAQAMGGCDERCGEGQQQQGEGQPQQDEGQQQQDEGQPQQDEGQQQQGEGGTCAAEGGQQVAQQAACQAQGMAVGTALETAGNGDGDGDARLRKWLDVKAAGTPSAVIRTRMARGGLSDTDIRQVCG
jgi:hypothetical protein